jgi:hypothetical protein
MGPTYGSIAAIINHYEAALGVITATCITGSNLDSCYDFHFLPYFTFTFHHFSLF